MVGARVQIPSAQVAELSQRWQIAELSLFGSVLRDDFRPDSDVDVLVRFRPGAPWNLFDFITLQEELSRVFGKPVDLVEEAALRNPFRRHAILTSRRVIYAG